MQGSVKPAWTVLVYQEPRSKLRPGLESNLRSMEQADLGPDIQVVVQGGGGPTTMDRWVIGGDSGGLHQTLEADSRSRATLEDFLAWGLSEFPAEKTMVVLAGHGEGFAGYGADGTSPPGQSGVPLQELSELLGRYPCDLLVFDACLMGQAEVLHSLHQGCDLLVASSEVVGEAGLPYRPILEALKGQDAHQAAASMVALAGADQEQREKQENVDGILTLAAYDTEQVETFLAKLDRLAQAGLEADPALLRLEAMSTPGLNLDRWQKPFHHYRDLRGFAARLADSQKLPQAVREAAQEVVESCQQLVLAHHTSEKVHESDGLAIYLPTDYEEGLFDYPKSSLAKATHWDDFLAHLSQSSRLSTMVSPTIQ